MRDDQAIRRSLLDWTDRLDVDTEVDLELVLGAGRARRRRHRIEFVLAACLVILTAIGGLAAWRVADRGSTRDDVIAPNRVVGTYSRVVPLTESPQGDAVGGWTLTLGSDRTAGLSAPPAWVAQRGAPSGITYVIEGERLRIDAFAGELCSGTVGTYAMAVDPTAITLSAVDEPCRQRAEVIAGRWARAR